MRKLIVCAAMALTLGMAGLAQGRMHRRGSPAEGRDLCAVVQAKAQQDPEGYAKVMQELQPELLQIQQKQDVDALCAFYDKAIAKLK
ncbi:BTB/POZ domain-containing protein KCTD2 [Bilophila wadsworthia]|uniref:BTB/POZ domain-containing protein KCTD2 n=1 Tax=Bilophila wadsworthia TaxID=35833 RepID=UPI003522C68C